MNSALGKAFGLLSLLILTGLPVFAQVHGMPPSVTSMGFGGHATSGITPSVTSLGPHGYTPGFNRTLPNTTPWFGVPHPGEGSHPHHGPHNGWNNRNWSGVYAVPYYYPYYGDYYGDYGQSNESVATEQSGPGPTIFERRGTGLAPLPTEEDRAANQVSQAAEPGADRAEPSSPQPETVLVFKDGHQLEVQNYAIVGNTLYDLTDGHRRKVPLADLDLTATTNQNDDRGIDFQVPSSTQAN